MLLRTEILKLESNSAGNELLAAAADVIGRGGVIVFPTETVYGLGGAADLAEVVEKIYRIKGRKRDKPLPRLIAGIKEAEKLFPSPAHRRLARKFWPGPLTLILPVPGPGTRGFRVPAHRFARNLIRAAGCSLAVTSANRSGEEEVTDGRTARKLFEGRVDLIVDGGKVPGGASTVLDLTTRPERILRSGPVTREEIEDCLGHEVAG